MREAFRPFNTVKTISTGVGTNTNVELKDATGTAIKCNYISVEATQTAGTTDDIFTVCLSGITGQTPIHASAVESTASGVVGSSASVHGGTVILSLDSQDSVSEIQLSHNHSASVPFVITYGNVRPVNPVGDTNRPKGN